jgi:hypothetical protein
MDGLEQDAPATRKKRLLQSTIHDPFFSASLGDLGVLAVNHSSWNRRREAATPYRVWHHEE